MCENAEKNTATDFGDNRQGRLHYSTTTNDIHGCLITIINTRNCSLSTVLTEMDDHLYQLFGDWLRGVDFAGGSKIAISH